MSVDVEILPDSVRLPALRAARAEKRPEQILYVVRPGIRSIPSGSFAVAAFGMLQGWTLTVLLWAIWWPAPQSFHDYAFSIGVSMVLAVAVIGIFVLLLRRYPGFTMGVIRAPFIRLTVTDLRVVWSLPWTKRPLMEIGRNRVVGGILGQVNARGAGSAALILVPGDPSADVDGNIHFDRLPDAVAFIRAFLPR